MSSSPLADDLTGEDPLADHPNERDPGLDGVVPFRFACHRCGHCCSGGTGHVWLEEGEAARLAARLGMSEEAFQRRHVRVVPDPRTGALRPSLRKREEGVGQTGGAGGRCSLLEGADHCTVYADRPRHCRSFPYWPSVLTERGAFEHARAICPGIAVTVDDATRRAAFARLEALYAEVDAFVAEARPVCIRRGVCCRFEQAGHELFATGLEADYAAARHPTAAAPEAPGRCPHHVAGRCMAREGRPLGCRTYFCDRRTESVLAEAHEHFLRALRRIEADLGYPTSYGRFPALLAARGIGAPAVIEAEGGKEPGAAPST